MKLVAKSTLVLFILTLADMLAGGTTHNTCHREPTFRKRCWRPAVQDNPCVLSTRHDSYLMLEPEIPQTPDVIFYKDISYTKITGNDQCAWQTGSDYSSTCPHHYVMNYDENRRPKKLIEAKCNCDQNTPCLNGTETFRCMPVKYNITVLRKNGCSGGIHTYTTAIESITVGCTCAYSRNIVLNDTKSRIVSPE